MTRREIELWVNGEPYRLGVPAHRLLIDVLRDDLHLTGTKRSCDIGVCGSCSVLVDGKTVSSCLMFAVRAAGRRIVTIEGLSPDGRPHPLQRAFVERWGLQCGFCTPGMLMTAAELLASNPDPTPEAVRAALSGNLCRCTGYRKIVESVLAAAAVMRGGGV